MSEVCRTGNPYRAAQREPQFGHERACLSGPSAIAVDPAMPRSSTGFTYRQLQSDLTAGTRFRAKRLKHFVSCIEVRRKSKTPASAFVRNSPFLIADGLEMQCRAVSTAVYED
jgi:hypothetical protein